MSPETYNIEIMSIRLCVYVVGNICIYGRLHMYIWEVAYVYVVGNICIFGMLHICNLSHIKYYPPHICL